MKKSGEIYRVTVKMGEAVELIFSMTPAIREAVESIFSMTPAIGEAIGQNLLDDRENRGSVWRISRIPVKIGEAIGEIFRILAKIGDVIL